MSADTQAAAPTRPERGSPARSTIVSVAVAALLVAVVTVSAQAAGRFHWWAGFVLVPGAMIAATGAALMARGGGRALAGYVIACVGGLVYTVGALLMFGAMGAAWPFMIVLPALAIAGTYLWRPAHPLARAFHRTIATLALAAVALGVTLMLLRGGQVDFGETSWWGAFMMLAGVIVFLNGLELLRHRIDYRLQAVVLAVGPAVVTFLLGLRFLRGW